MQGLGTFAARGMWRLVRACAITASVTAGAGLMTAPAHAQVVASGASAGQDVLGQWSARVWAAGAGGDARTMLALMDEAPAEYPELNALLGSTVEHLRASFVAREEQRAEQIAEAETHLQEAFDKGDKPEALSEALRYAIELDMLAVDKAEFRRQPRIVELARRAHLAGMDAESKNDWMMASELFYRLTLIDEHNTQYKENWERISRRLSMIAMYAPERIWKMRNDKRLAEGETALPPYNPLGDGWAAKMEGVTLAMVSDAIDRSARMHVDGSTPMSEMALSGLEAVRNMATTEDLWEVFPGLANQEARERFLTQLSSMSRDINADPRINKSTLQSILRQVASSSEWVGVDPRAVMHEFGNGAMQTLDEFSAIIWPDELRRFQRNTQGKFVGIGVQIRLNEESYIEVVTPLEGTPAQRIGILMGDVIKAINGNSAVGMSLDQAVDAGFDRLDRRFQFAGMPHHVRIGKVHDDGVKVALLDGFHYVVGDARGAHLRLQIVRRNFGRWHHHAFFATEGLLDAAVEKIGDVRVLLCFRDAQILQVHVRETIGEDVVHFFRAEDELQPRPRLFVLRHRNVEKIFGPLGIGEALEVRLGQGLGGLPGAIGAEVEKD